MLYTVVPISAPQDCKNLESTLVLCGGFSCVRGQPACTCGKIISVRRACHISCFNQYRHPLISGSIADGNPGRLGGVAHGTRMGRNPACRHITTSIHGFDSYGPISQPREASSTLPFTSLPNCPIRQEAVQPRVSRFHKRCLLVVSGRFDSGLMKRE
jgi:hypothetical protein